MSSTNRHCSWCSLSCCFLFLSFFLFISSLIGSYHITSHHQLQILVVSIIILIVFIAHSSRSGVLLIEILQNGLCNVVKLLLFLLVIIAVGVWIVVQPIDDIIGGLEERLFVLIAESAS